MVEKSFVHLHNHSEFSFIDGSSSLKSMAKLAKKYGMPAIALTDHGNLYGAIDFYNECKKENIKPIIGCEFYVAPKARQDKDPSHAYDHLTVIAKNNTGYKNLIKLVSISNLEGFYYRPRIDKEILKKYKEGLIVLSGCPSAELSKKIISGDNQKIHETISWFKETFKEDYYLEIMRHELVPDQEKINQWIINNYKELGIKIVATNDNHYETAKDYDKEILLKNVRSNSPNGRKDILEDNSYYIMPPEEVREKFSDIIEACDNTLEIAEKCELKIDFSQTMIPEFATPDKKDAFTYLKELCYEGLKLNFPEASDEINKRLEYELSVIKETDFADYFLVVWDIFQFVNNKKILTTLRGSATASLVLFCLGITKIDPVKNKLVFERFLNIERKEMPDIDIDFQDDRRKEVLEYCTEKYGSDHIAQIIAFSKIKAKGSIRDAGRVMELPLSFVDKVAKLIPNRDPNNPTSDMTLEKALNMSPELRQEYDTNEDIRNLFENAKKIEGSVRNIQTHAAGVIISKDPLDNVVPIQRPPVIEGNDSTPLTQFEMFALADLGLLKMDFLGLSNLTIIDQTVRMIEKKTGEIIDLNSVPKDDTKTFDLLSDAKTSGVFQLESSGMKRYIKELKPTSINDISAMIALYRPGPMEHISTFINSKHGKIPIKYPHESLESILKETYGIIVYQDQVLLIAQSIAGYSLGDADSFRKAMGKKIPQVMAEEKGKFIQGTLDNGFSKELGEKVFELIEPFAGYAFNKAHSVSYAMIGYWTAYFKANYPEIFMSVLMKNSSDDKEKISTLIAECNSMNIAVSGPNINMSEIDFEPYIYRDVEDREEDTIIDIETYKNFEGNKSISYGLGTIKNISSNAITPLVEERKNNGKFKSIEDFITRMSKNPIAKGSLEPLIKVGAFDEIEKREILLPSIEKIATEMSRRNELENSGQANMFDLFGDEVKVPLNLNLIEAEVDYKERMFWERDLLGTVLSENPINKKIETYSNSHIVLAGQLNSERANAQVKVIGQVISTTKRTTRAKEMFLICQLGLLDNAIELVIWPDKMEGSQDLWENGTYLELSVKTNLRNGSTNLIFEDGKRLEFENNELEKFVSKETIDLNKDKELFYKQEEEPKEDPFVEKEIIESLPNEVIEPSTSGNLHLEFIGSKNLIEDKYKFEDIMKILLENRSEEQKENVLIKIIYDEKSIELELPICVNVTEELNSKLDSIIGQNNVIIT
ncbi:MAG: DNA polymerase III subunit alpha [Chloroflexota bacterium]|nr:DNA polymerase III subunit alpha [Chloroflexota bacterium]MQG04341.1 DNA polymerase III subunit alpha [SAR202 cluster bacterium]|tara:strand:+ start:8654 stop:12316 length:3663 start_codon:yes stop_codon:yes gene_type:complete